MSNLYVTDIAWLERMEVFEKAFLCVNKERQQKIQMYQQQNDRARSLAAGLLLKHAMYREKKAELPLVMNTHGRPYARECDDFYFSLSHSGNYAICAVGSRNIGADIQEWKELKQNLASRFFHQEEILYLEQIRQTSGEEEYCRTFFNLWSLKESYIKYTGVGFAQGMQKDNLIPLLQCGQCILMDACKKPIQIFGQLYQAYQGYSIGVVSSEDNLTSAICYLSGEELLGTV